MRIITSNLQEMEDGLRKVSINLEFSEESEIKYDLADAGAIAILNEKKIISIKLVDFKGNEKNVQLTNDEVKQIEYYLDRAFLNV